MSRNKKLLYTILCSGIFLVGCMAYTIHKSNAFNKEYEPYIFPYFQDSDDTLRIAYIGDSWANMHEKHNCQIPKIISDSLHLPVEVYSFGIGGRTSKEIYEDFFRNSKLNNFLKNRRYDYCFISLGINDAYKKKKLSYYQQSMFYIIKFFIANNVCPIILEIPEFDIGYSYETLDFPRKFIYGAAMIFNGLRYDSKQQYRDALDEMIIKEGLSDKVKIIRYKTWNKYGNEDWDNLYSDDRMHLNEMGYAKLDSCIAITCIQLE